MSTAVLPARCVPTDLTAVPHAFRKLIRFARKEGWLLGKDGGGHVILVGPHGEQVRMASTPCKGQRTRQNYLHALRKAGVPGA